MYPSIDHVEVTTLAPVHLCDDVEWWFEQTDPALKTHVTPQHVWFVTTVWVVFACIYMNKWLYIKLEVLAPFIKMNISNDMNNVFIWNNGGIV